MANAVQEAFEDIFLDDCYRVYQLPSSKFIAVETKNKKVVAYFTFSKGNRYGL